MESLRQTVTLALTGASGAIYGLTLAEKLLARGINLHFLYSPAASQVVQEETGKALESWKEELKKRGELHCWGLQDFRAPIASGSYPTRGMIIAPCSMGTLGRIASGHSSHLIERAADVCLKERRRLLLLCRETPLSSIHLENMLRIDRAGGIIMPPIPAFYTHPRSIGDIVHHSCDRALELMGFPAADAFRWGSSV